MRAWNGILIRWSWPRIKRDVRETKSEWESERADALSQIGLVAAQGSSTQPSVCAESWGLLSISLRVSQRQLLEYQQLLKHCSPWERLWSTSWDKSPAYSLLHHNRGTNCFQDAFCACYWSTCHCWPAWKRDLPMEYWVASWEQGMKVAWRKSSWWMRPPEMNLPCSGRPWQNWRWKLFLTSKSKTQRPLSLPALHSSVCGLVSSSGNQ